MKIINEKLIPYLKEIKSKLDSNTNKLNNNFLVSEKGHIYFYYFNNYTFGSSTFSYYQVTFKKTYKNIPTVIITVNDQSSKGYYGNMGSTYIKDLTKNGFVLVSPFKYNAYDWLNEIYVDYIVISND